MNLFCSHGQAAYEIADCEDNFDIQVCLRFCLSFKYIAYTRIICMFYCHWIVNVRTTASVCGRVKTRTTDTRTSTTSVGRCCVRSVSWLRTIGKTSISWWVPATVCIYQLCVFHQSNSVSALDSRILYYATNSFSLDNSQNSWLLRRLVLLYLI